MKLISSVLVGLGSATHNSGSYSWYDYSDWYTNSLSDWSSQWYNSVYDWSSMYSNYYSSGSKVSKWYWPVTVFQDIILKSWWKDSSDDSYWYSNWYSYFYPSYLFDENDYSNYVSSWDFSLVIFFITNEVVYF